MKRSSLIYVLTTPLHGYLFEDLFLSYRDSLPCPRISSFQVQSMPIAISKRDTHLLESLPRIRAPRNGYWVREREVEHHYQEPYYYRFRGGVGEPFRIRFIS